MCLNSARAFSDPEQPWRRGSSVRGFAKLDVSLAKLWRHLTGPSRPQYQAG